MKNGAASKCFACISTFRLATGGKGGRLWLTRLRREASNTSAISIVNGSRCRIGNDGIQPITAWAKTMPSWYAATATGNFR